MTDQYDEAHQETGSSNISKATPEWKQILKEARARGDDTKPVLHTAYDIVNAQVKQGILWSKCANCGSPYKIKEDWANDTVCSEVCQSEYDNYVTNPMSW